MRPAPGSAMTDITFFWPAKDNQFRKINLKKDVHLCWSGWLVRVDGQFIGQTEGAQIHAKRLALAFIKSPWIINND